MANPPFTYADIHSSPARVVWRAYDKPYFGVLTFSGFEPAWNAFGSIKNSLPVFASLGIFRGVVVLQTLVSDLTFRSRKRYVTHDVFEFDDLPF